MAAIDIGSAAINRSQSIGGARTVVGEGNPANLTGTITTVEIWADSSLTSTQVATFYGSGTVLSTRDYEDIGAVTAGSKQTFSGLDMSVSAGDFLGIYWSNTAHMELDTTGVGYWYSSSDYIPCTSQSFTYSASRTLSLYGTGASTVVVPTVTTQTVTNVQKTTATGNGNITATGGANCTTRGFCYMTGTSGDPTTANSTAYDTGSFGVGAFSKGLTGLTAGTNYRVRAYAINSAGTAYGATVQTQTITEKAVSETINIVDSKVTSFTKTIAEAFSIVDSFISRLALEESLNTTDSIIRMGSEAKAESFNTTDSWTARISLAEIFNTVDSLVNSASLAKSEAFNIVDSWFGRLKLSEAFQTVDSFTRTISFHIAETLGVVDSYITGAIWTEEIKNTIDWTLADDTGWFSGWFSKGWFSGTALWVEEIKKTINWTEE